VLTRQLLRGLELQQTGQAQLQVEQHVVLELMLVKAVPGKEAAGWKDELPEHETERMSSLGQKSELGPAGSEQVAADLLGFAAEQRVLAATVEALTMQIVTVQAAAAEVVM